MGHPSARRSLTEIYGRKSGIALAEMPDTTVRIPKTRSNGRMVSRNESVCVNKNWNEWMPCGRALDTERSGRWLYATLEYKKRRGGILFVVATRF